jgi:hypothetical protein
MKFKQELIAFRQHLMAPSSFADLKQRRAFAKKQKTFLAVIDRWIEHPHAENAWATVLTKWPDAKPGLFIAEILQRRDFANDLNRATDGLAEVERKNAVRTKKHLKEAKGASKVEKLKLIALENALLAGTIEDRDRVLSRKRKTAARQHFCSHLSKRLMDQCGHPLDDVVSLLVYVAFGEDVTADAVRLARQHDPRIHPAK